MFDLSINKMQMARLTYLGLIVICPRIRSLSVFAVWNIMCWVDWGHPFVGHCCIFPP